MDALHEFDCVDLGLQRRGFITVDPLDASSIHTFAAISIALDESIHTFVL